MCCFSGRVEHVSRTKIFARALADGRQALAYEMAYGASEPVAMVLPIPTPPSPAEDAVHFVDLSKHADFFERVQRAFPVPAARSFGPPLQGGRQFLSLAVHDVGDFEASFVPTASDFARLHARFRLPEQVWASMPEQRTYGFVVAKLKAAPGEGKSIHPLAFTFPRRDARLFFPTVHVHDGAFHETADFAHALYAQGLAQGTPGWWGGFASGKQVMDETLGAGLVDADATLWSRSITGTQPNTDVWV